MRVGVVGCGVMGGAMARIVAKNHEVLLYDHKKTNSEPLGNEIGGKVCDSMEELGKEADVVILAVKPKQAAEVADELDPLLNNSTLLLSILGGVTLEALEELFSTPKVFRMMPNLPLLCGKGVIAIVDDEEHTDEEKSKVEEVLQGMGKTAWLQESLMNAFAALVGSSPAFVYLFIEAMTEAGISLGFKANQALDFVLDTIEGSVELLRQSNSNTQELRWQISSPGGTTIAGLNELEAYNVRHGVIRGVQRTSEKADEMH